jgi:hypothetical protein
LSAADLTSPTPAMASAESADTFTPKDPIDVVIGRYTASLYFLVTPVVQCLSFTNYSIK